jgi:hypothetical protein
MKVVGNQLCARRGIPAGGIGMVILHQGGVELTFDELLR